MSASTTWARLCAGVRGEGRRGQRTCVYRWRGHWSGQGRSRGGSSASSLTDGRHTWASRRATWRVPSRRGVPVFCHRLGARQPRRTWGTDSTCRARQRLQGRGRGSRVRVRVTVCRRKELVVELLQDGKGRIRGARPAPPPRRRRTHLHGDVPHSLERWGCSRCSQGRPTAAGPPEITLENNQRTVTVRVTEDKAKVLLIGGEAAGNTSI